MNELTETEAIVSLIKDKSVRDFIVKVQTRGDLWTTQDCKPFSTFSDYRQIENGMEFMRWLEMQPYYFRKQGYYEEVVEVWVKQSDDTMVRVWKKGEDLL